ncbi:gamma-glutamylcyclotransferase family protein [Marinomonas sp. THO17]|uniref:gamma-glutamylcyclotransferase family protein n=1 Tax=Marinomonas sp. THO17 TaxID=3149048 RepID=UPI00336C28B0
MSTSGRHFILGYGSLINADSRAKTGETGNVWPVKLQGYARHWSVMSTEFGMSSVAVVAQTDAYCNGVLVEVAYDQFTLFDERERGYQRSQIAPQSLTPYQDEALPQGTYWIYHTHQVVPPDSHCPIALSYVDVILAGCLEHSKTFANDFLLLTQGWHQPTLNDRLVPRYPRVQADLSTQPLNQLIATVTNLSERELSVSYEL